MAYVAAHSGGSGSRTILRCRPTPSGRSCVRIAVGDVAPPPDPSSLSSILGIGAPGNVDPVILLKAELNRFADPAAGKFQAFNGALPLTSDLDATTAGRASALVALRPLFSTSPIDAGTAADLERLAIDAVTFGGTGDPIAWAKTNLSTLISVATGIADVNKLPAAQLPGLEITPSTLMIAAVGVGVLWVLLRGTGKKRSSTTRRSRRYR